MSSAMSHIQLHLASQLLPGEKGVFRVGGWLCVKREETMVLIEIQKVQEAPKCPYQYLKVNLFVAVIK